MTSGCCGSADTRANRPLVFLITDSPLADFGWQSAYDRFAHSSRPRLIQLAIGFAPEAAELPTLTSTDVLYWRNTHGVTNALALLRLLPMSDRDKDAEILALRHQVMVLERQLGGDRVRFAPADRA